MYNIYSNQHAILSFIKCPCARNLHRLKSLNRRPVDQLCVGTFVPNTSDQSWLGTWVFCLQDSNKRDQKGKTRDDKAHLVATDTVEKNVTWLARPMKKLVLPRNKLACGRSLKKRQSRQGRGDAHPILPLYRNVCVQIGLQSMQVDYIYMNPILQICEVPTSVSWFTVNLCLSYIYIYV